MIRNLSNLDAAQSAFFLRELEHVKARSYDVQYPDLKARVLIPVSTEAGPGAEAISYQQFDEVGIAKLIASYAEDLPRADVFGKEFTSPVKSIGVSYGYNIDEIAAAQMAGRPLQQRKANAARRAFEERVDQIARTGNAETGLKGLLNHPNIPITTVGNGAGGDPEWSKKTPAEIVADINAAVAAMRSATHGREGNNLTLLLPDAQYTLIAQTQNSTASDVTILQFVLASNPFIEAIEPWWALKGAGSGGVDRAVLYTRHPDKLTLEIPKDFDQLPVQERGLEYVVPCHGRIGGVIVYYPLSARYIDGI